MKNEIFAGGVIMYGALVLFEDEFIHIVSISFSALILTELIMVALTIRTWHRYGTFFDFKHSRNSSMNYGRQFLTTFFDFSDWWWLLRYLACFFMCSRWLYCMTILVSVNSVFDTRNHMVFCSISLDVWLSKITFELINFRFMLFFQRLGLYLVVWIPVESVGYHIGLMSAFVYYQIFAEEIFTAGLFKIIVNMCLI